jgi:hypothetical protein
MKTSDATAAIPTIVVRAAMKPQFKENRAATVRG